MATPRTLVSLLCPLALALAGCEGRIDGGSGTSSVPGGPSNGGDVGPGNQPKGGTVETPTGPVSCDKVSVGPSALTRLTRAEYQNTVHDLTGLELDLEGVLPEDEKLGSFSQNSVAPVSVNELGHYRDAAERVAAQVASQGKALLACTNGKSGSECAGELIRTLGERLHRTPLPDTEQQRYLAVFNAQSSGGFEQAMSAVLEALLQSPYFLYRLELPAPGAAAGQRALTGYELASRLSFLLWKSAPDAGLLGKAAAGQLETAEQLSAEAQRLLADSRAERAIAGFHREWLGIANLSERPKDTQVFPDYSSERAAQMQLDAERFAIDVILKGDGTISSLLQAPFTAAIDGSARTGLLLQPAFLASHASADTTSIVLRGHFVRANLFCDPPPPPPANADVQAPELGSDSTLRERFAAHEEDPNCAGCHLLMDPIGFGFEAYDAIGRYRATEAGRPVNTSGEIIGSQDADGTFNGAVELSQRLAQSEQVRDCVARTWFSYAFGRAVEAADACAFRDAYAEYQTSGYDVRKLLLAFVMSDAFRLKAEAMP